MGMCMSSSFVYGFVITDRDEIFESIQEKIFDGESDFCEHPNIIPICYYDEPESLVITSNKFNNMVSYDDCGGNTSVLLKINDIYELMSILTKHKDEFDNEIKELCKELEIEFKPCTLIACGNYN